MQNSRNVPVKCECKFPAECQENISSLSAKIFEGAKNLEVLVNSSPLDFLNRVSPLKAKPCASCQGEGKVYYPNGADDYDTVHCTNCNGTGKVVATN